MSQSTRSYIYTQKQYQLIESSLKQLDGATWDFNLPVLILNRSWLRLEKIKLCDLSKRIPPDNSKEAPELVHYYQLIEKGRDPYLAVQECWWEFGMEDFHKALRNYWVNKERGNYDWTFKKYMSLTVKYKSYIERSIISMPIIILGNKSFNENHKIEWLYR